MTKSLLVFIILFLLYVQPVQANSVRKELVETAKEVKRKDDLAALRRERRYRIQRVKEFLDSYGSPMSGDAPSFVDTASRLDLDYRLLPAISIVESTGGRFIPYGSFNAWGWNRGRAVFSSFTHGISVVGIGLAQNYNHGNIRMTGYRYCPPSDCDTERWIRNVTSLMQRI